LPALAYDPKLAAQLDTRTVDDLFRIVQRWIRDHTTVVDTQMFVTPLAPVFSPSTDRERKQEENNIEKVHDIEGHPEDAARPWRGVIADHLLPHLIAEGGTRRRIQPVHLLLPLWLLATLALAGPTWQREPAPPADDEAALVIVIAVTPTMLAQDIQPSRLERAAQKIHGLLALRPGTRTALVAYTGSAYLVMPLTRDADFITRFAAELSPTIMPMQGDVPAEALTLAAEQLRKSGLRGSILLISDSVPAEQLPQLSAYRKSGGVPVQLFAGAADPGIPVPPVSPPAPALNRGGFDKAADALDATLTLVCPDDRDVRWLALHTETSLVAAPAEQAGERWQDLGYWLAFAVAALALMWFRPGWLVKWQ
jgi:Ca-activated chloride channel family protein